MPHVNNISETTKTYYFGDTDLTNRAYTGHEHLPDYQLINMNGRMYDPITKQMTSPDILDQSTYFTQSYNRYSYGLNNPMSYTDPSGYVEIGHRAFWPTPTGTAGGSSIDDWGSWAFMQQMYNYNPMDDYYFMVTNESASGVGTGSILDLIIATGGSSQGDGGQKEGDGSIDISSEVGLLGVTLESYKNNGWWVAKTTNGNFKLYNVNAHQFGNQYTSDIKFFKKAGIVGLFIQVGVDGFNLANDPSYKETFLKNTGLGIASIVYPEIGAGVLIYDVSNTASEIYNHLWDTPPVQNFFINLTNGFNQWIYEQGGY